MRARQVESRRRIGRLRAACTLFALALTSSCSGDGERSELMQPQAGSSGNAGSSPSASGGGGAAPPGSVGAGSAAAGSAGGESPSPMEPGGGTAPDAGAQVPSDGLATDGRIVAACRGLALEGMQYSPGGNTLPNKCAPFDMRNNNPYAIRCIDAMPDFETRFPGDDYCILPPPPDQGFQVGVHPLSNAEYWERMWAGDFSFYRDPAVTGPYELAPATETVQNYNAVLVGPTDDRFFYRRQFRGRYGSHHGMVRFAPSPVTEDGWQDNGDLLLTTPEIITLNNAYLDYPQHTLEIPPEEAGIGYRAGSTGAFFNLHHFNSTDGPLLRENWVNVWYVPADQVTKEALYFTGQAPVDYPPGMVLDSRGSVTATVETEVLSMIGHRHGWTPRFHAWLVRAGSTEEELIYDSYDWGDMPTFSYNSRVMNPAPGEGVDGASSGPLVLQPGDTIHFNCHVDTTRERADELGVDMPSAPLRFGNQAFAAEMCILNGHTTGGRLGFGF